MKRFLCSACVPLLLAGCLQTVYSSERVAAHSPGGEKTAVSRTAAANERSVRLFPKPLRSSRFTISAAKNTQKTQEEKNNKTDWQPLFDGESLEGWSIPVYGGDGEVDIQEGNIVIGRGEMMTGIRYEREFPTIGYEVQYEAQRTQGYDFFAACTFPAGKNFCSFVNGGWGGGTIGISSINGFDASENETNSYFDFREKLWYRFHIRVMSDHIQVWITPQDNEGHWGTEKSVVELKIDEDTVLSTRLEMDQYKPFGFSTWSTEGRLRKIEYRAVEK